MAIMKVREFESSTTKTLFYIALGIVVFSAVGFAFNIWEIPTVGDTLIARDIVNPYIQFYPTLILALAIAATVLIAYVEKESYAYLFAGTGFAVIVPNVYEYLFVNNRYDLALLGFVIWAVIPVIWVYCWKSHTLIETTRKEKFFTSLKATILSYPIYLLTSIIAIYGESARVINAETMTALSDYSSDIFMFILWTIWLYFLLNIIIVNLMFAIHDLALHILNMRRVVRGTTIYYEMIPAAVKAAPAKPKIDHYAGLISEMQVFSKYIGEVDRIKAASVIGRFKSEYQTLAAKYEDGGKADAERMIKSIEFEFMKKY
ncbi:hypothetical protein [Methanocella paludicola]|nr:hypothetical protein [Methanocella paludicola]